MAVLEGDGKTRPLVMGIINATPDSFHESSRKGGVARALKMVDDGASWIDIGGESTRPGAKSISIEEEMERVIPIVTEVSQHCRVSIDTRNHIVAKKALEAGASMINDVSGLRDQKMFDLVIESGCSVCIMHMQGEPGNMQKNPKYHHVLIDIYDFFENEIKKFKKQKYSKKLILDPGINCTSRS